jgi:hypothetical protein
MQIRSLDDSFKLRAICAGAINLVQLVILKMCIWVSNPSVLHSAYTRVLSPLLDYHGTRRSFERFCGVGNSENSLKIDISIHNWTSKTSCSIRYIQYVHISFWTLRKWLYKRRKRSRRSQPPSAADFLCCVEVLNTVISWESKMKYAHIEYI